MALTDYFKMYELTLFGGKEIASDGSVVREYPTERARVWGGFLKEQLRLMLDREERLPGYLIRDGDKIFLVRGPDPEVKGPIVYDPSAKKFFPKLRYEQHYY